ncbi:hypothetical protein JOC61_000124 [Marinitoga litoralis]|nr:hypothetical protein [Marinitoga litoralis]MBM7558362.1 hypothetical protein [Marinitoga litoralis]
MKKAIIIDINKNHFNKISDFIILLYKKDPLNFVFLGPSGDYVKQVAENVARKIDKTLNRDAFRVNNQYTVFDENRRFNPKYDESQILEIEADMVVETIGQMPDYSSYQKKSKKKLKSLEEE